MIQQIIVFAVIIMALFLFIDGRIRYDFVGLMALLILVITGIVSPDKAFLGFGHPAVVTVAAVLVISNALIKTGVVDHLVVLLNKGTKRIETKIFSLMLVTAVLSSFMNNVGALAIIMPVAMKVAKDSKAAPSIFLMPVAFASLLGGMVTEIGTPPNLIISMYRKEVGYEPFGFFDFAPTGTVMVLIGLIFIPFIGWHLIPKRSSQEEDLLFGIEAYLSEALVTQNCKMIGKTLKDFYGIYKLDINVISILRNGRKIIAPLANEQIIADDILIIKALPTELAELVDKTGMSLIGDKPEELLTEDGVKIDELAMAEVVLREDSPLIGRTVLEVELRNRFNVNLVAVSRKGTSSVKRLKHFKFKPGDILLIQVPENILQDTYYKLRALPLAERGVTIRNDKNVKNQKISLGIFVLSIILTSLNLVSVQIAFSIAAVLLVVLKIINAREFYDSIEWPTLIMLGSLLPLGESIQSTGIADMLAELLLSVSKTMPPIFVVGLMMLLTMILTNIINNAAAAVLMAPIAMSISSLMGASPDPLLMAVCISASSAFLTPIGHQSNLLVMGPGGYHFGDYWKMGLPLSILIILVGAPIIMHIWAF